MYVGAAQKNTEDMFNVHIHICADMYLYINIPIPIRVYLYTYVIVHICQKDTKDMFMTSNVCIALYINMLIFIH